MPRLAFISLDRAQPLRHDLCDLLRRPKVLTPDVTAIRRASPNATVPVGAFELKQSLLCRFVVHELETR